MTVQAALTECRKIALEVSQMPCLGDVASFQSVTDLASARTAFDFMERYDRLVRSNALWRMAKAIEALEMETIR